MTPIRVLFIHGLESHPNGSKTRMLREQGFDVVAPDMHMGLLQVGRRNSALRQLPRLGESRIALVGLLGLAIASSTGLGLLGTSALALAWGVGRRKALFGKAIARSFDACIALQREAVERERPDVIVGSSWGGAVAAELIARGVWSGPTILLAPAVRRVSSWAGGGDGSETEAKLRARSAQAPIVIFHDPKDHTVPHEHSVELARGSKIDLRSVDAGGHRLLGLLERGELAEAIRRLAAGARSS